VVVAVLFGGLVEYRSAFLTRRMGDFGVYVRGAWAVRTGKDLYTVTSDNNWHYNYPPLLAILLMPLADPPAGEAGGNMVPYKVSVAAWYVCSVLFLVVAIHLLASALEETAADRAARARRRYSRAWWYLRGGPLLACLPPTGHTLARGQTNTLLLLLLCGLIAELVRGRRLTAGLYLAGAICLKLFPAYLLLYPLWRRDGRCLAGCALGLIAGLLVVPGLVLGPGRTVQCYRALSSTLIAPALGLGEDESRRNEITALTSTDNQSFQAMIHYALYRDAATRPADASVPVRTAHWVIGAALTAATLAAARWRAPRGGLTEAVALGALILVMLLTSPVCHSHYFILGIPLVMALIAAEWARAPGGPVASLTTVPIGAGLLTLFTIQVAGDSVQLLVWRLRELGVAGYVTVLLWLVGCVTLRRLTAEAGVVAPLDCRAAA
jgi:hypothetical protein